jgi:hypothetical protein
MYLNLINQSDSKSKICKHIIESQVMKRKKFIAYRNFKQCTQLMLCMYVCESFFSKARCSLIKFKNNLGRKKKFMLDQSKVKPELNY